MLLQYIAYYNEIYYVANCHSQHILFLEVSMYYYYIRIGYWTEEATSLTGGTMFSSLGIWLFPVVIHVIWVMYHMSWTCGAWDCKVWLGRGQWFLMCELLFASIYLVNCSIIAWTWWSCTWAPIYSWIYAWVQILYLAREIVWKFLHLCFSIFSSWRHARGLVVEHKIGGCWHHVFSPQYHQWPLIPGQARSC